MNILNKIGLTLFVISIAIFTLSLGLDGYTFKGDKLNVREAHKEVILNAAQNQDVEGKKFANTFDYVSTLNSIFKEAQIAQDEKAKAGVPEGLQEWEYKISKNDIKNYKLDMVKASGDGLVSNNKGLFWLLTVGLGILGGLIYILPTFMKIPGIKNDHIYHRSMQRGLKVSVRGFFLGSTIIGILLYGVFYTNKNWFWPVVTLAVIGLIMYLVLGRDGEKGHEPTKSASPNVTGWLGVVTGTYLIGFYLLLYWMPEYIAPWIKLSDPVSMVLSGNPASRWFLYGMLYTVIVLVMGIRMIAKYRHNRYQIVRTISVMFFQTCFAFLIPEILTRLNMPSMDLKNLWPLNYSFFFDYNISQLIESGGFGIFLLVWGTVLALIGVPVFVYFFGKRWYCSWVCGCGGLAETLGDPYRQLSDKSLRAWKYERFIIHGVLVFAVVMTIMVLYTYFTGASRVLWMFDTYSVRSWYGFLVGSAFAGVVGTGFYPLMGNRAWCRFGCPLAAYLGLVQKFKSKFRITTNGSQCISCGNCSTYCEMGIDVRWYAQRGQDIVRSSCVGCGVCSAVCPRGVLRLENASGDIAERADHTRAIHISEDEVRLLS
jgi:polyferredoxin